MSSAIYIRSLVKSFRNGDLMAPVLKQVDLTVEVGESFFIVGPSGCGKTTLISVLCGTLYPDEGELVALGENLRAMSPARLASFRAQHIGFVFQQFNLIPTLTVAENVAIPLRLNGTNSAQAAKIAISMLEQVGLAEKMKELPKRLSGGQQQRVAIARALVHQPDIVVCDEPTSALDSETGRQVMALLRNGSQKRTIIVVTHDPRIYHQADRIAIMEDGRVNRTLEGMAEIQRHFQYKHY